MFLRKILLCDHERLMSKVESKGHLNFMRIALWEGWKKLKIVSNSNGKSDCMNNWPLCAAKAFRNRTEDHLMWLNLQIQSS